MKWAFPGSLHNADSLEIMWLKIELKSYSHTQRSNQNWSKLSPVLYTTQSRRLTRDNVTQNWAQHSKDLTKMEVSFPWFFTQCRLNRANVAQNWAQILFSHSKDLTKIEVNFPWFFTQRRLTRDNFAQNWAQILFKQSKGLTKIKNI